MPLPKGIYSNPDVRRAWIEERQPMLDEFDRLVAAGMRTRGAARQVGCTHTGIGQMRASLERLGEPSLTGRSVTARIDLGLALLSLANPGNDPARPREALTHHDIAAWCGCTHSAIQSIERRALRKLHRRLNALLGEQVIHGEFGAADITRALHPLAAAA